MIARMLGWVLLVFTGSVGSLFVPFFLYVPWLLFWAVVWWAYLRWAFEGKRPW